MSGTAVADLARAGYWPLQHHETKRDWPLATRLVSHAARVLGRREPFGDYELDKATLGPVGGFLVWLPESPGVGAAPAGTTGAQAARIPIWASAFPVIVDRAARSPNFNNRAAPKGGVVVRPIHSTPGGRWAPDPSRTTLAAAGPPGLAFPVGTAGLLVAGTSPDAQEQVFLPSFAGLAAVHWGGAENARFGTWVHDVTPAGILDQDRRARVHSAWRTYRLPEQALLPFAPELRPATTSAPADALGLGLGPDPSGLGIQPAPEPSRGRGHGLAWQLGVNVEGRAGRGVVADAPGPTRRFGSGLPVLETQTFYAEVVNNLFVVGTLSPTVRNTKSVVVTTRSGPVTFFVPEGARVEPSPGAPGQFRVIETARGERTGRGIPAGATGGSLAGSGGEELVGGYLPPGAPQVLASLSVHAGGPLDVGEDKDLHELGRTADGETINSAHLSTLALWRRNLGEDGPLRFQGAWAPSGGVGPGIWQEVLLRWDPDFPYRWLGKELRGQWRWQVPVPFFESGGGGGDGGGGIGQPMGPPPMAPPMVPPMAPPMVPPMLPTMVPPMLGIMVPPMLGVTDGGGGGGGGGDDGPITEGGGGDISCGTGGRTGTGDDELVGIPRDPANAGGGGGVTDYELRSLGSRIPAARKHRRHLTSPREIALPSLLLKAPRYGGASLDPRYGGAPAGTIRDYDRRSPVTARLAAHAKGAGGTFAYRTDPCAGGYTGGETEAGGVVVSPPGLDGSVLAGDVPAPTSTPETNVVLWGTDLSFGTPDAASGLAKDGFRIGLDGATKLAIDRWDPDATVGAPRPFEIDDATQECKCFGVTIGGAGGGEQVPGLFGDGHAG